MEVPEQILPPAGISTTESSSEDQALDSNNVDNEPNKVNDLNDETPLDEAATEGETFIEQTPLLGVSADTADQDLNLNDETPLDEETTKEDHLIEQTPPLGVSTGSREQDLELNNETPLDEAPTKGGAIVEQISLLGETADNETLSNGGISPFDLTTDKVSIDDEALNEQTPLIMGARAYEPKEDADPREPIFLFLEAKTPSGLLYETFTIVLILLSVLSFVFSSLFIPEYNAVSSSTLEKCGPVCDAIWFGIDENNALEGLGIGATSVLEIFIVGVFTIDYFLQIYTADLLDTKYKGLTGRLRFMVSFFSLVDLASTLPFYIDAFFLPNTDLAASNFLRMFRLLRMMKMEGRYDLALGLLDDVLYEQKDILGTGLFIGFTTWAVLASFFFVAERKNKDMIYCGAAPERCFEDQDEIDTSLCEIDVYGFVDCSEAGCASAEGENEPCWNVYRSVVSASFWTLMELFGEFPLVDQHSSFGQVLGTFTAVVAVAVFALPAGIIGSGFEEIVSRRVEKKQNADCEETSEDKANDNIETFVGDETTLRGSLYNFLHLVSTPNAKYFDFCVNILILGTSVTFMLETLTSNYFTPFQKAAFDTFELLSVIIFTVEYSLRVYSIGESPAYRGFQGRLSYATSFVAIVDLLSFLPYWIDVTLLHHFITPNSDNLVSTNIVKFFRLLRILRFEKYTQAFTTFDDIVRDNLDVLSVTGFSAMLLWIFFSAILYYTERDNPDTEMANYYKSVPHAMWITLLNLSGECPLAFYSVWGKVINGIIGLFATALFGIPIGLLGAGFEEFVANKDVDTPEDLIEEESTHHTETDGIQAKCYKFVNGIGSTSAAYFELLIYFLIIASVTVGIIQTVEGYDDAFYQLEWISVVIFTFEYVTRTIGASVDPEFSSLDGGVNDEMWSRLKYLVSFYSIVDLLAIIPFYLSVLFPDSWFDDHHGYLRMLRLFRLLKLDKYFPSITLIDDVLYLKRDALKISCFAGGTLWILFGGIMYLAEFKDHSMEIDNLPLYNCDEDCTMSDRYRNFFTSMSYIGIHLTGDFPIVEYGAWGRVTCFFVVIAAVGVVSIPSALVASGFSDIVNSKSKKDSELDEDWYEKKYRELDGQSPPLSRFGTQIDDWQHSVHAFLNGAQDEANGIVKRSKFSTMGRNFFFVLIISNVLAVIIESIPEVNSYVGNDKGNFFDVFEEVSVLFFTIEYILRLFSAAKSRKALYSPLVYATTFFGLVDFLSVAPWYIQQALFESKSLTGDEAQVFRIFRIFRILQLEDFIIAFSKLDDVFRASKDVLQATGLMAVIIWVGSSALFFIFEEDNPNLRQCDSSIPLVSNNESGTPGCYDFDSTAACNAYYPDMCDQVMFTNMPNTMYYVAVFLGGDWGFVDFTWQGRLVCLFLCIAGIAVYAIPVGTLFDSFGAIVGISDDDAEEEEDEENVKA